MSAYKGSFFVSKISTLHPSHSNLGGLSCSVASVSFDGSRSDGTRSLSYSTSANTKYILVMTAYSSGGSRVINQPSCSNANITLIDSNCTIGSNNNGSGNTYACYSIETNEAGSLSASLSSSYYGSGHLVLLKVS